MDRAPRLSQKVGGNLEIFVHMKVLTFCNPMLNGFLSSAILWVLSTFCLGCGKKVHETKEPTAIVEAVDFTSPDPARKIDYLKKSIAEDQISIDGKMKRFSCTRDHYSCGVELTKAIEIFKEGVGEEFVEIQDGYVLGRVFMCDSVDYIGNGTPGLFLVYFTPSDLVSFKSGVDIHSYMLKRDFSCPFDKGDSKPLLAYRKWLYATVLRTKGNY